MRTTLLALGLTAVAMFAAITPARSQTMPTTATVSVRVQQEEDRYRLRDVLDVRAGAGQTNDIAIEGPAACRADGCTGTREWVVTERGHVTGGDRQVQVIAGPGCTNVDDFTARCSYELERGLPFEGVRLALGDGDDHADASGACGREYKPIDDPYMYEQGHLNDCRLDASGGTGDDRIVANDVWYIWHDPDRDAGDVAWSMPAQVEGGDGNDDLRAGLRGSWLRGGAGDDVLKGSTGSDSLTGGDGRDRVLGAGGRDGLHGDAGADVLSGGGGNDGLRGGIGADRMFGGDGDDHLDGVYGHPYPGRPPGSDGDDYAEGGRGNDDLFGGRGRDALHGGGGDDYIDAGTGNDVVSGGYGHDAAYLRDGDDRAYMRDSWRDYVGGGPGTDRARLDARDDRANLEGTF